MNKIYIEASVGEIIDKITILEIKRKKVLNKSDLAEINKEYAALKDSLRKNVKIDIKLKKLWKDLKEINLKIWKMEDHKRLTQKHLENLTEIAKNVYEYNDQRAQIKLKINKLSGSNLREVKKYAKY